MFEVMTKHMVLWGCRTTKAVLFVLVLMSFLSPTSKPWQIFGQVGTIALVQLAFTGLIIVLLEVRLKDLLKLDSAKSVYIELIVTDVFMIFGLALFSSG
jgi:threonine/homoserine/homoserine lactone efflux protein